MRNPLRNQNAPPEILKINSHKLLYNPKKNVENTYVSGSNVSNFDFFNIPNSENLKQQIHNNMMAKIQKQQTYTNTMKNKNCLS